jgi:hypothetical protein
MLSAAVAQIGVVAFEIKMAEFVADYESGAGMLAGANPAGAVVLVVVKHQEAAFLRVELQLPVELLFERTANHGELILLTLSDLHRLDRGGTLTG